MKKITILALAVFLFSFSGFATTGKADLRKVGREIKSGGVHKHLKSKKVYKPQYECYDFGYEMNCSCGPVCLEYTICADSFSEVWENHTNFDYLLSLTSC